MVDEQALKHVLAGRRIAGAAMDFGRETDQIPAKDLAALDCVIATPHIGGLTPPAIMAQALDTVDQVKEIVRGETPHGAVNPQDWKRR